MRSSFARLAFLAPMLVGLSTGSPETMIEAAPHPTVPPHPAQTPPTPPTPPTPREPTKAEVEAQKKRARRALRRAGAFA